MSQYKGKLTSKHVEQNMSTAPQVIIPLSAFLAVTGVIVFRSEERKKLLIKLLTNKVFMVTLVVIIAFSTWQLNSKDDDEETDRRKRATREAILGLIIAVLAYLDLKAAPFFIIWIVSYYLDK
tara:strand:- start:5 stop:373 length:369 start_codon:yes stop_codon:yes gene_type:complete